MRLAYILFQSDSASLAFTCRCQSSYFNMKSSICVCVCLSLFYMFVWCVSLLTIPPTTQHIDNQQPLAPESSVYMALFLRLLRLHLQFLIAAIKCWRCRRPGNKASAYIVATCVASCLTKTNQWEVASPNSIQLAMITIPPHSLGSGQSVAVHLLQLDPSTNCTAEGTCEWMNKNMHTSSFVLSLPPLVGVRCSKQPVGLVD